MFLSHRKYSHSDSKIKIYNVVFILGNKGITCYRISEGCILLTSYQVQGFVPCMFFRPRLVEGWCMFCGSNLHHPHKKLNISTNYSTQNILHRYLSHEQIVTYYTSTLKLLAWSLMAGDVSVGVLSTAKPSLVIVNAREPKQCRP